MSLPLLMTLAEELDNLSTRLYADDFGFPQRRQYPHHHHPALAMAIPHYASPRYQQSRNQAVVPKVGKDGFQICMDVQQFKPSELTVKTVDNFIVVEGKHEEREDDHGYISRHFVRRYALPQGYDPNHVASALSSDGVLTIKAPPPPKDEGANERVVQIQQTGPAHLSVKENAAEEESKE